MSFRKVNPLLATVVGFILWFLAEIPAAILGYLFKAAFNVYWYYGFLIVSLVVFYSVAALRLGGWKATPYLFIGSVLAIIVSYGIVALIFGPVLT